MAHAPEYQHRNPGEMDTGIQGTTWNKLFFFMWTVKNFLVLIVE